MSQYLVEPHAPWRPGYAGKDIIVAETDLDALRQARLRCPAGDLYRYAAAFPRSHIVSTYIYVARFFAWEVR